MKVEFTGVILHKVERDLKRGLLHFSASLTKPVATAMKWGELPRAATASGMDGSISDASLVMIAKQANLFKEGQFQADVQSITKFEIVRLELKGKKGKGFRHVVRFQARFVSADILALADAWIMSVGDGMGTMTISGELLETAAEEDE